MTSTVVALYKILEASCSKYFSSSIEAAPSYASEFIALYRILIMEDLYFFKFMGVGMFNEFLNRFWTRFTLLKEIKESIFLW